MNERQRLDWLWRAGWAQTSHLIEAGRHPVVVRPPGGDGHVRLPDYGKRRR
jgi:hypothetical protein